MPFLLRATPALMPAHPPAGFLDSEETMEPFIGEIRMFSWNWAPVGFALCNGAILQVQQNQALFALLNKTFGGDGRTTFALPDLQGRTPVREGVDPMAGHNYLLGEKGGSEVVTLGSAQVPAHNHLVGATNTPGDAIPPGVPGGKGSYIFANVTQFKTYPTAPIYYVQSGTPTHVPLNIGSVSVTGGGLPHINMQPYTTTNFCIATLGIWPPRQ